MSRAVRLSVLLLLLSVVSLPAAAQSVVTRVKPDWWGEADVFGGTLGLSCGVCSGRVNGLGGGVGFGIRAGRLAELGLAVTGLFGSRDNTSQRTIIVGPVARLYTTPQRTWQFRGGVGVQAYRAAEGTSRLTSRSLALSVGVAHRVPVGRIGDLTPHADLVVTPSSALRQNDRQIASAGSTTISAGVALRFD